MNSRQLAQVGLGLIGVWALLLALQGFVTLAVVVGASLTPVLFTIAGPVALMLGLSYVLVFRSSAIAAAIAPDAATSEDAVPDLSRILVVLLGVLLLVQAIPALLSTLLSYLAAGEFPVAPYGALPVRGFVGSAVQISIALFLIRRSDRLVEYSRRAAPGQTS